MIRSPAQMRMKFIQKVVMGVFIGSLYWQQPLDRRGVQNTNSALYFFIAELTFSTMFGIMTFMEHELPLISREYHDGLFYVISYYVSRCLSYLPLFTLDGAVMILTSYWMIGLNSTWQQVLKSVLISVLVEQAATSCGLFLACLFETTSVRSSAPAFQLFTFPGGHCVCSSVIRPVRTAKWSLRKHEQLSGVHSMDAVDQLVPVSTRCVLI